MGDISECIVMMPSRGRSGGGLIIFASTEARTLVWYPRTLVVPLALKKVSQKIGTRTVFCRTHTLPNQALDRR